MKRLAVILPIAFIALLLVQCDFPADPPLKVADVPIDPPPPPPPYEPDTLLPLDRSYKYVYNVWPKFDSQGQLYNSGVIPLTAPNGTYYRMIYEYLDITGESPVRVILVLPFVKIVEDGLEFYGPYPHTDLNSTSTISNPILVWKLPYPAEVGAVWTHPKNAWKVVLQAKNKLVYSTDGVQKNYCSVYDIYRITQSQDEVLFMTINAVPGESFFRIDHFGEDLTVVTYAWEFDK